MKSFDLESFPTKDEMGWSGNELKSIRERLGLTAAEFSRRIGVSRNTLVSWELNKVKPSPLAWKSLSEILYSLQKHRKDMQTLKCLQEREKDDVED